MCSPVQNGAFQMGLFYDLCEFEFNLLLLLFIYFLISPHCLGMGRYASLFKGEPCNTSFGSVLSNKTTSSPSPTPPHPHTCHPTPTHTCHPTPPHPPTYATPLTPTHNPLTARHPTPTHIRHPT